MKKPVLALVTAAAVAATPVVAPSPAFAADAGAESSADASSASPSTGGSSLSPAGVAGVVLGVLALAGAGAGVAVQRGLIQLPALPQLPGIDAQAVAKRFGVHVPGQPAPAPAQRGACSPATFDALVPGWPNFTGTTVTYCDGQWATAGANQTDWSESFRHHNGGWSRIQPAGQTRTGVKCYDGAALRQQGAPQAFLNSLVVCR
ncbi:hypothetical protein [Corynebacterium bouchesdurhonense]|uniref:hypothetical protein n=1 Tax=Corynebacterium bouchesdurhonense TaxID=1720192 RepID=UPI00082FA475|nr:hypothetical protein [Corynebacterium bouchesdurhonense]